MTIFYFECEKCKSVLIFQIPNEFLAENFNNFKFQECLVCEWPVEMKFKKIPESETVKALIKNKEKQFFFDIVEFLKEKIKE